jgi:hypothetical protein
MVDVGGAAAGLSMLASILSITRSVKDLMSSMKISGKKALEIFAGKASEEERKLLAVEGVSASIVAMSVIAMELLAQFEEELKACQARHIRDRKKAAGDSVKGAQADRRASICMCAVLTSIKLHNKGELEKGQLQNWWDSYGCV